MKNFEKDFIKKGYSIIKLSNNRDINKLHQFVISYLRKKVSKQIKNNLNKLNKYLNIKKMISIR